MQIALNRLHRGLQLGDTNEGLVAIFPHTIGSTAMLKFLPLKAADEDVQPLIFSL
jgi:hypothetical protein